MCKCYAIFVNVCAVCKCYAIFVKKTAASVGGELVTSRMLEEGLPNKHRKLVRKSLRNLCM